MRKNIEKSNGAQELLKALKGFDSKPEILSGRNLQSNTSADISSNAQIVEKRRTLQKGNIKFNFHRNQA